VGGHGTVAGLDGDWRVSRIDGALPPMPLVRKTIRAGRGWTRIGPLPAAPFRVEAAGAGARLVYRGPLSLLVDEISPQPDGSWAGTATLAGRPLGRFRMTRRGGSDGQP
jgi:hypothetical protein